MLLAESRRRGDRKEARRTEMHAPGLRASVRDDVAALLAARPFDRDVDLARGDAVALADDLEMVDERLHRGLQLLARRQYDLALVRYPGIRRHLLDLVEALLGDFQRLAHLVDADAGTGVAVTLLVHRHVELDLVVEEVGLVLADIPVQARSAQVGARQAQTDRVLGRDDTDSLRPALPHLVLPGQALVLADHLLEVATEGARLVDEGGRNVLGQPAGLAVAAVNAHAGDHIEQVEHLLALLEALPFLLLLAQLAPLLAYPVLVLVDAVLFSHSHPY